MTVSRKVWRRLIGKAFRVARRKMRQKPGADLVAVIGDHNGPTVFLLMKRFKDSAEQTRVLAWRVTCEVLSTTARAQTAYAVEGGPYVRQGLDEMFDDGLPDWETRMALARGRNLLEHALLPGRRRELQ